MRATIIVQFLIISLLFSPLSLAQVRLPDMGDPASQVLSETDERQWGKSIFLSLQRELPLVEDALINDYVQGLGERLAYNGPKPELNYHFFVVNTGSINAFAIPGGYIGINAGLILSVSSEHELASVLAHEIAHVTQRHIARNILLAKQQSVRNWALILAAILLGTQNPEAGSAAASAVMGGSIQQQLAYSRSFEEEADAVGINIMHNAGFDAAAMASFFRRLNDKTAYDQRPPEYLSTHPLTPNRITDAERRAADLRDARNIFTSSDFPLIQARTTALGETQIKTAVTRFRSQLEDTPSNAARYGLAVALTRLNETEEAAEHIQHLFDNDDEHIPYYVARAEILAKQKRFADAAASLEEGLAIFPGSYSLELLAAEMYLEAGEPDKAMQLANSLAQAYPERPAPQWLLARAANKQGNPAQAQLATAKHYYLQGDIPAAMDQLRRLLAKHSPDNRYHAEAAALQETWTRQFDAAADKR